MKMNEDMNLTDLTLQRLSDLTQESVFANMAFRALDSHNVWSLYELICWAYVCVVMLERIITSDQACEDLLKSFPFACMPWMPICHCFAV